MPAQQIVAIVIGLSVTAVAVVLFVNALVRFVARFRLGAPEATPRTDRPAERATTLVREIFGHTRMARKRWVAVALCPRWAEPVWWW